MKFNPLPPLLFLSGAYAFGGINLGLGGGQFPGINLGLGGGQRQGINLGLGGGQIPGINLGIGGGLIPGINFGIGGGQLPGLGIGFGGTQIPGFNFGGLPWLPGQGHGSPGTSPGTNSTFTQHYAIVCPHLDRQQLEINPGYNVVLYCGVYGEHNEERLNAKSLEQCAQLCENKDGCIGSTWLSDKKKCLLSGHIPLGFREQTIYMQRVIIETEEGFDPFAEDCEQDLQQCSQQNAAAQKHCEEQVRKCEGQCTNAQHQATEQLRQCQKQNSDAQHHSAEQLRQCSDDKHTISLQLSKCNTDRFDASNQLNQCNIDKTSGSIQLDKCNSEKLTTSTELSLCNSDRLETSIQLTQCHKDYESLLSQMESLKEAHQKEIEALKNQNNGDPMAVVADSFVECSQGESKTVTYTEAVHKSEKEEN